MTYKWDGKAYDDSGMLLVRDRPPGGVPTADRVRNGWAADVDGYSYVTTDAVIFGSYKANGMAFSWDGALHITTTKPLTGSRFNGFLVRYDGVVYVDNVTAPSATDVVGGSGRIKSDGALMIYNAKGTFSANLQTSLFPEVTSGSPTPTFTRATTATFTDWEGVIRQAASGESRFQGARRVANLVTNKSQAYSSWAVVGAPTVTDNFTTAPDGTLTAAKLVMASGEAVYNTTSTVAVGSSMVEAWYIRADSAGTIRLVTRDSATAVDVSVTTAWQRFSMPYTAASTADGPAIKRNSAGQLGTVYVWGTSCENVTGQSNQNPSEYVSVGVLSAPYHGAGIDGVKYFATQNANTVASNAVTEAQGAAIPDATLKGYVSEGASTNYALWSRDLTNAAWVKTTMTTALTATGADGVANSATTLTASAANGTALQTLTRASAARITSCYIKRRTGTGAIQMTQDNGVTWTPVTVTASYTRVSIPSTTAANPIIGFRIVTNGDAVDVDFVQHEELAFATSPIPTTTIAVARNADVLTYASAGNISGTVGSAYVEMSAAAYTGVSQGILSDSVANRQIMTFQGTSTARQTYDGTNVNSYTSPALALNTVRKMAVSWSGSAIPWYESGALSGVGVFDGDFDLGASIRITDTFFGTIRNVRIYNLALSAAQLQAMTT